MAFVLTLTDMRMKSGILILLLLVTSFVCNLMTVHLQILILKYLVQKRDKIVSREEIMDYLWESESFIDDNTLTVNITRLRNKLEELSLDKLLQTKRGQGYMLV